ncbi:MAG: hypothetical protein GVY12_13490 [Bacteroidetes bacterium]|jgi:hypothetical protein|nr:hypothetical protein [Bacteroidota bacterium]
MRSLPTRWPTLLFVYIALLAGGLSLCSAYPLPAAAQEVPRVLSYQGQIVADGEPVQGTVELTFRLHPASAGEATVGGWVQTETVTLVAGVASVLLGDTGQGGAPLPPDLTDVPQLFLGVSLDGEEIDRLRLTSAAFALGAERAQSAALADRAVVADSAAVADRATRADTADEAAVAEMALTAERATEADRADSVAENAIDADALQDGTVVRRLQANGETLTDAVQLSGDGIRLVVDDEANEIEFSIQNGAVTQAKLAPNAAVRSLADVEGDQLTGNLILQSSDNSVRIRADAGSGSIDFSTRGSFPSAARYKTQIRTIDDAGAVVAALRGVRYHWRDDGRADIGLIADEVAEVLPELVRFDADGAPEGVRYAPLVAVLIEHANSQQQTIDELHARVTELERLMRQVTDQMLPSARQE